MTKDAVHDVMGKPESIDDDMWIYSRPLNAGWVEMWFDEDGRLDGINDESVFPP